MRDDRFPKWLQKTVNALSFLSLPNLGPLLCGLAFLGYIGSEGLHLPMDEFLFDPVAFQQGQWWRIVSFPTLTSPVWLIFFCMYVYMVFGILEQSWGEAPLTIFTLLSYIMAMAASFASGRALEIWEHVLQNISLAFGTLFPEMEFLLFFIIPVKAKWFAMFAGVLFFYQFVMGSPSDRIFLFLVLVPYFLFFAPYLISLVRNRIRSSRNRGKWQ